MARSLEVTATPEAADLAAISEGLGAFNEADVGPSGRLPLAVLLRDDAGAVVAGASGYTAWGWLYVQWLFVAEPLRGQGLAGRLLQAAEEAALARGCRGAFIDTFNPKAEAAYRRQGYAIFGELPDFPPGRRRVFLSKPLGATS